MTYFIKTIVAGFIFLFSFSNIQSQSVVFSMPDEIYPPSTSFCIPVSVSNFQSIESIQCAI
ncbi:MAG TPA: hypothetical protein ENJ53_01595, partial [Phaeodactylibacter sp.]|nr:hypothetical protein [Phaeodactylibacter sp.]